jgi:ubiquinone/menaquinone biosynthesis C-methylase UbiE
VEPFADPQPATRFDDQAVVFDRRAGVPSAVAADVAAAVLDNGAHSGGGDVVLEIGAGTGEVGRHLAQLAGRYVGVDLSAPMLDVFRSKLAGAGVAVLVRADAERHWPVRDSALTVVFASRVAHLLTPSHVVAEARRVCRPGGRFLVGRIERSGAKQVLRRQRETLLADRGFSQVRSGGRRTQALLEAFADAGGVLEGRRAVTTWAVTTTAREVLDSWEGMSAMGGETVPTATKGEVLNDLRLWAESHLGNLDDRQTSTETYVLESVRLG